MKRFAIGLIAAIALPAFAVQAADKKDHPPEKAMDSATPEMKNPAGTKDLHPPQKAMDEATPTEKKTGASEGASAGTSGSSGAAAEFPEWDIRQAGQSVDLSGGKAPAKE